jgi:glutathione synthase/RimK-type ligase-like ATP-grasp enzyme
MKKKKPSLLCTEATLKSGSLRRIAQGLSARLKRGKIFRTIKPSVIRQQFRYGQSINKLLQYQWFEKHGITALEYTADPNKVIEWLNAGHTAFGRKYLNASCGKGIVVIEPNDDEQIPICPVYTKYKKKKREFRVHVFKDQVVNVVEKRKRKGFEGERDTKIRNLANGYVFCQEVTNEPEGLRTLALQAAKVSPSDFRGVDIGYNEKKDELFVIEVNSAPGIEGTNIQKYLDAMVNYV